MSGVLSTLVVLLYLSVECVYLEYASLHESDALCSFRTIARNPSSLTLLVTVTVMFALALTHFVVGVRGWLTEGTSSYKNLISSSPTGQVLLVTLTINVRKLALVGIFVADEHHRACSVTVLPSGELASCG